MKYALKIGLCFAVAVVLLGAPRALATGPSKDPLVKGVDELLDEHPMNVKLLFENNYVWVLEYRLRPGEMLPVHGIGNHAIYALSDFEALFLHNYEPSLEQWAPGEARWHRYTPHEVKNIGRTDARYLVVARKAVPLPKALPRDPGKDLLSTSPQGVTTRLENRHMRIFEVTLKPGDKQPMHQGLHRVIYSLGSYQIRMNGSEQQFHPGDVHFHGPGEHAVENTGASWAWYVVFELRK